MRSHRTPQGVEARERKVIHRNSACQTNMERSKIGIFDMAVMGRRIRSYLQLPWILLSLCWWASLAYLRGIRCRVADRRLTKMESELESLKIELEHLTSQR